MGVIVTKKLSDTETKEITSDFIQKLGVRLKAKRMKINLSQTELASCLNIDQTTLSKYEQGKRDMNISLLPLFSTYCNFPIYELFPRDESQFILDTFAKAVTITAERHKRNADKPKSSREVIAHMVREDGVEYMVPTAEKPQTTNVREQYRNAEMPANAQPYSDAEFYEDVKRCDEELKDAIVSAGQFLNAIDNMKRKNTIKGAVADYIIDELVINAVSCKNPSLSSRRLYAYYQKLYRNKTENDDNEDLPYNDKKGIE